MMKINSLLNSLPFQGKEATKGFTLVELIVVITILAILGTIAFISLQGYSKDARDSVRISDISKIKTSLELFQLNAGKYPETTDPTNITYSGALAWAQGTFGETTYSNVEKLDKIPTDPVTDRKYVYSVTNTKQEYQIAGIMEGDEVTGLFNQTNAAGKTAMLKISGNYNGKVLKVSTGGTDYVLAIPSIITSSGFTVEEIVENNYLAYNGYKNLPAQYTGSSYDVLGDNEISLVNNADLIVYSGDLKTLSSSEKGGIDARKNLIIKLKSAYSGTAIIGIGEIAQIINTNINDDTAIEFLGSTIVSNNLGGSISVNSGGGLTVENSCDDTTKPADNGYILYTINPTSVNQNYVKGSTECGFTCIEPYTGDSCEVAPVLTYQEQGLCNIPDIHVPTGCIEGENGCYLVAGCNVGTLVSGTNSSAYGNRFQWGNSELNITGINSTQILETTDNSTYKTSDFISLFSDWTSIRNDNLWGDNLGEGTDIQRIGPCPTGYHVPSQAEWTGVKSAIGLLMESRLILPRAGFREGTTNITRDPGDLGFYWSSSPNGTKATVFQFGTNWSAISEYNRSNACSVRCFKN